MNQQEPVYDKINRNGRDLAEKLEPGAERDDLEKRLDEAEERWTDLKKRSDKRKEDIDQLYPLSKRYSDDAVLFSVWLDKAEKKKEDIEKQPLKTDKNALKKQEKDLEVGYPFFVV